LRAPRHHLPRIDVPVEQADPLGDDLQLALCVCYELHCRGFGGGDPRWEWDAGLVHLRTRIEDAFLDALRLRLSAAGPDDTAATEMERLSIDAPDGQGPSYFLRDAATWEPQPALTD
ncbi:MAG: iron-containing redox enzyme family protein, partial [Mycolicibacterium sp.]|nr:iron-containing redox enzyme family protein [Mycolicibacterium sp.]